MVREMRGYRSKLVIGLILVKKIEKRRDLLWQSMKNNDVVASWGF